jgi:hypothetical protein
MVCAGQDKELGTLRAQILDRSRQEPTECFNPTAVVMHAEALSRKPGHIGAVHSAEQGIRPLATSAMRR